MPDEINRKRISSVQKRNMKLKFNKNNKIAKQNAAPKFTTKPLSKKKARLLNKRKGEKEHARMFRRRKNASNMAVEEEEPEAPVAKADKMQ
mmetsp:Transcript_20316/g.31743  ORF Transcript_20316/g.31743 Transcript_20316/m.31743 type:complete len:91 (-) Transcript_20316:50-322(-)